MSSAKWVWRCLFSPKLNKIYGNGPVEKLYEPTVMERWGDQIINSICMMCRIGVYSSPFLAGYLYHKGYYLYEGLVTLTKIVTGLSVILVFSYCIRGLGRANNPTYRKFIHALIQVQKNLTPTTKRAMAMYDFEFFAWPVEFSWADIENDASKQKVDIPRPTLHQNPFQYVTLIPCHIIAYIAMHTFGIRLIYPGSIGLLQVFLAQTLLQGRSKLIEVNKGARYKLLARDNNDVDVMFVDRRNSTPNGNTLVISCEGNAGLYEIGIMSTPIEAGYSVIGWNHPGFGGSTGKPFPDQEQNAIDIVVQFAIYKLGFRLENIILFGWSIGGYTATWAAMNYPDAKAVILDATFDDILPLAKNFMPSWAESIVRLAIRKYCNLNIGEQLIRYPGPVLLIRRTEDEVICTKEHDLSTNRGNNLLIKLLRYRYPELIKDEQVHLIFNYLTISPTGQDQMFRKYDVNSDICTSLLLSYISEHSKAYPLALGEDMTMQQKDQMALFLAKKYLKDYKSSHCTPLISDLFQMPWDLNVETDYVFT